MFEIRYNFERRCSKQQLVLFDLELAKYLQADEVRKMLLQQLDEDIQIMKQIYETVQQKVEYGNDCYQVLRLKKRRKELVRNMEAEKKLIAYTILIENKYNTKAKIWAMKPDEIKAIKDNLRSLKQERYQLKPDLDLSQKEVQKIYRDLLNKEDFSKTQERDLLELKKYPIDKELQ